MIEKALVQQFLNMYTAVKITCYPEKTSLLLTMHTIWYDEKNENDNLSLSLLYLIS